VLRLTTHLSFLVGGPPPRRKIWPPSGLRFSLSLSYDLVGWPYFDFNLLLHFDVDGSSDVLMHRRLFCLFGCSL